MPESYSVNQFKTWSKCQKKYEFDYVRKLYWPANPKNFRVGKGVHQLLDYESRHLPLESILHTTDTDIRQIWEILHRSSWANLPVLASEWGFSLEIHRAWIYGRVDRIARYGEDIHILDWKTGTGIPFSPETDWQTRIYLLAVYQAQRNLGLNLPWERFVFTYVQVKRDLSLDTVQIPYSKAMHDQTVEQLTFTLHAIQDIKHYRLPPACPDRYCPYRNICGIEALNTEETAEPWEPDWEPLSLMEEF